MQTQDAAYNQRVTELLQQQATMAAQAATQALHPQEGATEQIRLQRANLLMLLVLNIPEFEGEASTLTDFVERGKTLVEQLVNTPVDPATDKAIRQLLVGRVASHVRRELGVTADVEWEALVRRLKDQYGGARKPYQKQAVTLISASRQRGESPTQFASRMEEGTRQLKARVFETAESTEEAHQIMKVLELLVNERLRREMPERVKKVLVLASGNSRIDEVVDIIRAEDEEYREANEKEERWTKVQKTRRPEERYVRREKPRPQPQFSPPRREDRPRRQERTTDRKQWDRPVRRCFECRSTDHLARECPYMARRGYNACKPEPMDVNMVDLEKRYDNRRGRYFWVQKRSTRTSQRAATEGSTSELHSDSEATSVVSESGEKEVPKNRSNYAEVTGNKLNKK